MTDVLLKVSQFAVLVFLLSSMSGVGLSLTVQEIIAPFRMVRLLVALLANFMVLPLAALGVCRLFGLVLGPVTLAWEHRSATESGVPSAITTVPETLL